MPATGQGLQRLDYGLSTQVSKLVHFGLIRAWMHRTRLLSSVLRLNILAIVEFHEPLFWPAIDPRRCAISGAKVQSKLERGDG